MRLIDADALREHMYHEAFETDTKEQRWDSGCWIRYKMFERIIDSEIAIDPVKHGRWTYKAARARSVYFIQHVQCNVCGHIRPRLTGDILRYCPHCGALMDEVTE